MKKHLHLLRRKAPGAVALGFGLLLFAAWAVTAEEETNPAANTMPSSTATNTNLARVEIPESEFVVPTSPIQGRDPFFPLSRRVMVEFANDTAKPVKAAPVALTLQGISGTESKRYALISGRTLVVGEEAEIVVGAGRARVRCINIKEDSVTIEVDGNVQELKLRPGL